MNPALLIAYVLSVLSGVLKASPGIPSSVSGAVTDVSGSIAAVIAALHTSGDKLTLNPGTILLAISGVVDQLSLDPNLPQDVLDAISSLDSALKVALEADKSAIQHVDYSTLHPESPV